MSYSIKQMRDLSDEALIEAHDQAAQNTFVGVDYFLAELRRRDGDRLLQQQVVVMEQQVAYMKIANRVALAAATLSVIGIVIAIIALLNS